MIQFGIGRCKKTAFLEQRNRKCFGYSDEEVGKSSKWWFDKIHPEDSIKMSIRLYSFIEQKTENWQDQYRFKCE
jgi:hypothetical protein